MDGWQPLSPTPDSYLSQSEFSSQYDTGSNRCTVPEKEKLQTVIIPVGSVHHITNQKEAQSIVVVYGDVTKGCNQSANYLLYAASDEYHIIKANPNPELGVLIDEQQNSALYASLVTGNIVIAMKSTDKKKHRIVLKDSERLNVIATPGHTYAIEREGDVSHELYYALEYGNDLYVFPHKGRRYVVEVPQVERKNEQTNGVMGSAAASYILIKSKAQ